MRHLIWISKKCSTTRQWPRVSTREATMRRDRFSNTMTRQRLSSTVTERGETDIKKKILDVMRILQIRNDASFTIGKLSVSLFVRFS